MVQLLDRDIRTREVLGWKGVHILHFLMSSCSQKVRIFLNLKGIKWESHPVDLAHNQNLSEWFLGINPRGLVPVLVHDGAVHIESNDILMYLDGDFPQTKLIPMGSERDMAELLKHENDLHFDLRSLTFRFVFAPPGPPKSPQDLKNFAARGSGTVQGKADPGKAEQIAYWDSFAKQGVSDQAARASALTFRAEFDKLNGLLAKQSYLHSNALTVLDIAWFIYVNRLSLAGYPIARLHPRLNGWFEALLARPEFSREIKCRRR